MSDSGDDTDEELARTAEELADTLRDLRQAVEPQPRRGPLGLPRPPSPREVLEFTDDVAIPAAIAVLEANIRILEAVQRAIEIAKAEREARERGEEIRGEAERRSREVRETAGRFGEETLDRLDDALVELQRAVDEGALPQDETAREILTEARELRDDLDEQVRDAEARVDEQTGRERRSEEEDADTDDEEAEPDPVQVDVDSELESLRSRYDKSEDDESPEEDTD